MIPIIPIVQQQASHIATKEVDIGLVENGFFFVLSAIAGLTRQRFVSLNGKRQYANFFGVSMADCVSGDTEFLTKTGWKRLDQYEKGDQVLSWNENFTTFFDEPLEYIAQPTRGIFEYSNREFKMNCSDSHNVPILSRYTGLKQIKGSEIGKKGNKKYTIPFNFYPPIRDGLHLTDDELRLHIAFTADGSFQRKGETANARIRVKNENKKQRLRELLQNVFGSVDERITESEPEYSRFYFEPTIREKSFDMLWEANQRQLNVIASEVALWDGNGSTVFRTTKKNEADFIQYVWQSIYNENITLTERPRHDKTPFHTEYKVLLTKRKTIGTLHTLKKEKRNDTNEYCFTMPNGRFIIRSNNHILLTLNSGAGKDTALKASQNMFAEYIEQYVPLVKADFERLGDKLPNGEGGNDEQDFIPPTQYSFPLRGSVEGIMRAGNFYNRTEMGSLNVVSTEFGSEYNPEVLPILTTLWQDAKADGSTNVNQKYPPIFDVPTNTILFGSASAFHKNDKKHAYLEEAIESGFARRATFVWVEAGQIVRVRNEDNRKDLQEYADQIIDVLKKDTDITFNDEAEAVIYAYADSLDQANNDAPSNWAGIKSSSIDKVERLSALIALADLSVVIEPKHVEYSIDMNERSFEAMNFILRPHAQYINMYKILLSNKEGLSQTELIDFGVKIKTKTDWEFQKELLKDLAYRKNMQVKERGIKIMLREFDVNKLDRMILSTAYNKDANKPEMEVNFVPQEVGFFGEGMTIEALITSGTPSFCLAHFETTNKAPEGHRRKESFIPGQNMIAFDIDEGLMMEDAKEILKHYTWLIYTTRNHQKEKKGIICDRFRIILPTKTNFFVTVEQHKELYENLSKVLEVPTYDVSTRNVSRLWFTNPEAEVFKNEGDLLDVRCCIPETETAEKILPNIENLNLEEGEGNRRIEGMMRYVLINTSVGNRNQMIFRLAKFTQEMGGDYRAVCERTNAMLTEPLHENELNTLIKNIRN